MNPTSTIDFTTQSDKDLESALRSIDRAKYEANYEACRAEIEKRKAEGKWQPDHVAQTQQSLQKIRKGLKTFALVQAIGGVFGFGYYLLALVTQLRNGQVPVITVILFLLSFALFAATAWAGWRYWKTERDQYDLWKILLGLQIPAFGIAGISYEFFCGFRLPIGIAGGRVGVAANFASSTTFLWNPQNPAFHFSLNIAAIVALVLLTSTNHTQQAPKC